MSINARIDADLETILDEYCEQTGYSRSDVIREALKSHLKARARKKPVTFYGLAADLIPDKGLPDRQSRDTSRIMREHWRAKRAA